MSAKGNHASIEQEIITRVPGQAGLDLATQELKGIPEDVDEQWFRQVYTGQGDTQPQLTLRAVLTGGILGMLLSTSNLYTTLKLGWIFGVAITACVLSFVIWNGLRAVSRSRLREMTLLENNCMQSTASAAGYSTGSTVATAFGALLLTEGIHRPWYVLGPFVLFTAVLGVLIAIPMKRQMINHEQLRFPSGTATAEMLRSLYAHGVEAVRKAYALLGGLAAGALLGFLRTYGTLAEQLRNSGRPQVWLEKINSFLYLPAAFDFPHWLSPLSRGHMTGLTFEPSVLLIGAGMITGLRVSLSMLLGGVLLYFVVAPWLLALDQTNAGVTGYIPSFTRNPAGDFNPTRWGLWGGTSLMVFSSLAGAALQWRTLARALSLFRRRRGAPPHLGLEAVEVPLSWLVAGLIPVTLGMLLVQYLAFQISVTLGLIAVGLSFLVSLVCCRATGETDTTPIGAMGKLTQLLYAVLPGAKGLAVTNLMAAGATASAGAAAADLLTDLKSGYILGANPRKQFLAQLIGVFFGTLAIVPAWYLMVPTKGALEAFNPPTTNMWKAVSDLLTGGIQVLPSSALWAMVIGALMGVGLPLAARCFPRTAPWLPSTMGLGLSWLMVFQNSLSFALGGVGLALWTRLNKRTAEFYSIPTASGLIAGESLVAALIAIACTLVGLAAVR